MAGETGSYLERDDIVMSRPQHTSSFGCRIMNLYLKTPIVEGGDGGVLHCEKSFLCTRINKRRKRGILGTPYDSCVCFATGDPINCYPSRPNPGNDIVHEVACKNITCFFIRGPYSRSTSRILIWIRNRGVWDNPPCWSGRSVGRYRINLRLRRGHFS